MNNSIKECENNALTKSIVSICTIINSCGEEIITQPAKMIAVEIIDKFKAKGIAVVGLSAKIDGVFSIIDNQTRGIKDENSRIKKIEELLLNLISC